LSFEVSRSSSYSMILSNILSSYSPELVQDSTRDFSVCVLDPLELLSSSTPDPSSFPASTSQQLPRGVAVGLGLMSWALLADKDTDGVQVTGTVMTMGRGCLGSNFCAERG
jgi:hypothetical protein